MCRYGAWCQQHLGSDDLLGQLFLNALGARGELKRPQDALESTLTARRLVTHLYLQNTPEATVDAGKGICQEGQTDRLILVPHRTLWERHSPCQPAMQGQHFEPSRPRLALRRPDVETPGRRFFRPPDFWECTLQSFISPTYSCLVYPYNKNATRNTSKRGVGLAAQEGTRPPRHTNVAKKIIK
jgi:hypothetical protein